MNDFVELTQAEMMCYDGGGIKEVVTTIVGVCGGIVGACVGFLGGSGLAGVIFTPIVSIPVGVAAGAGGAWAGYANAKSAAEDVWDYFFK